MSWARCPRRRARRPPSPEEAIPASRNYVASFSFTARTAAALFFGWLLTGAALTAFSQSPAPAVPAWQRDLAAAQVLQTAAALATSRDPAAAQVQRDRLGQLYRDLAAKYPNENAVQHAAADYFGATGNRDLAIRDWHRAETLDPQDAAGAEALGSAALARGDVREARSQFQRAVDARPGEALYHFDLANVLYLFRHDLANPPGPAGSEAVMVSSLEQFRLASDLAPQDARLAQAYAETFYMLAKPDWTGALAAWEKVRSLNAPNSDFANGNLARISLRLGRPEETDKYLDAIRDPGFAGLKAKLHAQAADLRRQQAPPAPH
jgi:tetratricopeptide (TPR) repeat protein